jgi:hypothetical protein
VIEAIGGSVLLVVLGASQAPPATKQKTRRSLVSGYGGFRRRQMPQFLAIGA